MRKPALALALFLLGVVPAAAAEPDWGRYEDMAVERMARYLQLDTTNPPGNEMVTARFFKEWFEAEGIPVEVYEFAPGRANLIARLKGDGSARPLILANHMDVVSSDPARWRVPPFSGAIVDDYMYGRGALDMKGLGLLQAVVMVMLKREAVPLRRDVVFLATSDEEDAMAGAGWLAANQRDSLAAAEFILTEGGENLVEDGRIKFFGIDNSEKAPFWLQVRARGRPGHGSRPRSDSASHRLVRALARVAEWETPLRILPGVEQFFRDVADQEPPARAAKFRNIRAAMQDPAFRAELTSDSTYNYLFRNTVSITVLQGSQQTNVIPGEASAHLDVRLLPGEDPQKFLADLRAVLNDDAIEIEPHQGEFRPANSSPTDTAIFKTIQSVVDKQHPGVPVTTRMLSGYTECGIFRQLGIHCYGFEPFLLDRNESATVHGDNERISVKNVRYGLRFYYEVVEKTAR